MAADTITDADALDAIASMLRDPQWGVGMLEDIAVLVAATGRSVEGTCALCGHPADGSPDDERCETEGCECRIVHTSQSTWDRH
jgi:hypothetical protein